MTASTSKVDSTSETELINKKSEPLVKKWLGHSICRLDTLTWFLGCALLITGIALFVLQSLYAYDFYIAAVTTTSVGGGLFIFGFLSNCCCKPCLDNMLDDIDSKNTNPTVNKSHTPTITPSKSLDPVDLEMSTEDFFASKGVFGLSKKFIQELDIWRAYRANPEGFTLKLDAGFILYGLPGTGKTTLARYIAELLGGDYLEKSSGDLAAKWHGETEQNISNLFPKPQDPFRIIVIDEISGILGARNGTWHDRIVEHFLAVVTRDEPKQNYLMIGTTNYLNTLDSATIRRGRLGAHFEVSYPDKETRTKIFNFQLSQLSFAEEVDSESFAATLANRTDGKSYADISALITDAQKAALLNKRNVLKQDFLDALSG